MLLAQTNHGPCRGRTDERGLNPCGNSKSYCRGSREFQVSWVAISKALRTWKEDWGVRCRHHVAEPGPPPRMQKACLCAHTHACTHMEELPHRHVTRVSAYVRLHLLFWLPVLGTSLYYACVHMFARTHLCMGTVSLLTCLRSLQRGNMAASSLHPQCHTWHSVPEQGCPGKQERHHGDGMRYLRKKQRLHRRWREDLGV